MEGLIGAALARALESGRDRFNARFAQARREMPRLDGSTTLDFLRRCVDPVAEAVAAREDSNVADAVDVLYDVSLEMLGKGLVGPGTRYADFETLWRGLMVAVAAQSALAPRNVIPPLTNALYQLVSTRSGRAAEWVRQIARLAAIGTGAAELLQAAPVAAWLCGMAAYRTAALAAAGTLRPPLIAALLASEKTSALELSQVLKKLEADPWYHPFRDPSPPGLRLVAEVGGFRGSGGEFVSPPRVAAQDGSLFASDGRQCWMLLADACGSMFVRVPGELPENHRPARYDLARNGTVTGPASRRAIPLLAGASSFASTDATLAATLPTSHRVFLVTEGGT